MKKKTKRTLTVLVLLLIGLITAGALLYKREHPAEVQSALVERVPQLRAVVTA